MSHEEIDSRLSPFDCIVCGGSIYGRNLSMRICLPCKSFYKRHVLLPANVFLTILDSLFSRFVRHLDIKMYSKWSMFNWKNSKIFFLVVWVIDRLEKHFILSMFENKISLKQTKTFISRSILFV